MDRRRAEYASRRLWGSIFPFPQTPLPDAPPPGLLRRSLAQRLRAELPVRIERLDRSSFPPPWQHLFSHPRLGWQISPIPAGPDRDERCALLDSLHHPTTWMVYCDGSFVWCPNHPHTSRSAGAAILVSDTTVIDHLWWPRQLYTQL